jgi:hypothetical protein
MICSVTDVCIATATSLALGNIDIDQAVSSTIVERIAAAKLTLIRMAPTSGSRAAPAFHFRARRAGEV